MEDIHTDCKIVMTNVCNWIGVEWQDSLLKTTFMGKLWHNRHESIRVTGVNNKILLRSYSEYLWGFDKFRLKLITKIEQEYFSYNKFNIYDKISFLFLPIFNMIPYKADFNWQRLKNRMQAMLRNYSNNKSYSVIEWIIFNDTKNTEAGAFLNQTTEKSDQKKRIISFAISIPFFLMRIVFNYLSLRFILLQIWLKCLFVRNVKGYVPMLYDVKELLKNEK